MNMLRLGITAVGLIFFVGFSIANLGPATNAIHGIRSNPRIDALACTTGAGDTDCTITLTMQHFYGTTQNLSVRETAPSGTNRTAQTIIGGIDRRTLDISGLATSTAYTFSVAYQIVNPAMNGFEGFDTLLERMPLILLLVAIVAVMVFGGIWALVGVEGNDESANT